MDTNASALSIVLCVDSHSSPNSESESFLGWLWLISLSGGCRRFYVLLHSPCIISLLWEANCGLSIKQPPWLATTALVCTLPSFVDKIHDQRAEDEEDEQGDEHVVDGPYVVHFKQLTVGSREPSNRLASWTRGCATAMTT